MLAVAAFAMMTCHMLTPQPPAAIEYRKEVYVSLRTVAGWLDGTVAFTDPLQPLGLQPLTLTAGGKAWQFPNGGDQVRADEQKPVPLARPVLVHSGEHYVHLRDLAPVFGYTVGKGREPGVTVGGREHALKPTRIDSPHQSHTVEGLVAEHRVVKTAAKLKARTSLAEPEVELPKGVTLLVRRAVTLDGKACVVLTDCGPAFTSYLAEAKAVDAATEPADLGGTGWATTRKWFDKAAVGESGLRKGAADGLKQTACLTIDLCWSLRPFEPELLAALRSADRAKRPLAPVFFLSGRWMQQHPTELHELIEVAQRPGVGVTWGQHSFDHPKSGKFMNDYPRDQLRADNLKQEALMLEWGLVPSAYYRFPGLIHDRERLDAILDLDLFPIDCDSWTAIAEASKTKADKGLYGHPVSDGSVILIHGNGNEPAGIRPFLDWLADHPDWTLAPISRTLPTTK